MSSNTRQRWAEIETLVSGNKSSLTASTHLEIKSFAEEQGLMTKNDFPKFKHSLKKIGVFYDDLRSAAHEAAESQLDEAVAALADAPRTGAHVTLWSAAVEGDDGSGAYAVVAADRSAVWYGRFFDDDRVRVAGDLVSAEQSAAEKAVWIGTKALSTAGEGGWLTIVTTCPHLEIDVLQRAGARQGVAVDVDVDEDERAIRLAETPGFQRWQDTDLARLVEHDEED